MRLFVLVLALSVIGGCKPAAPGTASNNPVKWTLSPDVINLSADSVTPVRLAATIDMGWYIYAITQKTGGPTPMTVTVAPSPPFTVSGSITSPAPVVVFDKEFNMNTERYEGAPSFIVPVATTIGTGLRPESLDVKVRFQACNETLCLPARTVKVSSRVQVAAR